MSEPLDRAFPPPTPSDLGDREVPRDGDSLDGVRLALLVTGSIAAFKSPLIARALRRQGGSVRAFASSEALRFVTEEALSWACNAPVVTNLTAESEHLSDEAPFDIYLCAPATLNTISKVACGIADGVVTAALASALGRMERGRAGVLLAPCMHGSMHTTILERHVRTLTELGVRIIPPRDACGKHNLPEESTLVEEVVAEVRRRRASGGGRAVNARGHAPRAGGAGA